MQRGMLDARAVLVGLVTAAGLGLLPACPGTDTNEENTGSSSSGSLRRGSSSGAVGSSGGGSSQASGGASSAANVSSVGGSSVGGTSGNGSSTGASGSSNGASGGGSSQASGGTGTSALASSSAAPSSSAGQSSTSTTTSSSAVVSSSSAAGSSSAGGGSSLAGASSSGGVNGGETCALATPLTVGMPLDNQTNVGATNDYSSGTGCQLTAGRDVVYSVTVPANTGYRVTITPNGNFDPTLSVVDGTVCTGALTCITSADVGAGGETDQVDIQNTTGNPKTYAVLVDSYLVGGTGTFSIRADSLGAANGGETCGAPQLLAAGNHLGLTTVGFSSDYPIAVPGLCRAQGGPDRVFQLDIPQNRRLRVVATPVAGTFDLVLNLKTVANCASTTSCLTSNDDGVEGDPETLIFDNPGAARTVLLVLGSYPGSSASLNGGALDLLVQYLAIP